MIICLSAATGAEYQPAPRRLPLDAVVELAGCASDNISVTVIDDPLEMGCTFDVLGDKVSLLIEAVIVIHHKIAVRKILSGVGGLLNRNRQRNRRSYVRRYPQNGLHHRLYSDLESFYLYISSCQFSSFRHLIILPQNLFALIHKALYHAEVFRSVLPFCRSAHKLKR